MPLRSTRREPQRDGHLKSPDFFEVETHPTLSFKSTAIRALDDTNLEVTGDLTIHGVTKSVTARRRADRTGQGSMGQRPRRLRRLVQDQS